MGQKNIAKIYINNSYIGSIDDSLRAEGATGVLQQLLLQKKGYMSDREFILTLPAMLKNSYIKVKLEGDYPKVLCHVAGASGAGKSKLGEYIQKLFPQLKIQDLDEQDEEATKNLGYTLKKDKYTDNMLNALYKERQKLLNRLLLQEKKPIILVGIHTEGQNTLSIPTANKFYLNTSPLTSCLRAMKRDKRKVEDLPSDLKQAQKDIEYLQNNFYTPKTGKQIVIWLQGLISTADQARIKAPLQQASTMN